MVRPKTTAAAKNSKLKPVENPVEKNPLDSQEALNKIKTLNEEPIEKFSLFDMKGNSKARENKFEPQKFQFKVAGPSDD